MQRKYKMAESDVVEYVVGYNLGKPVIATHYLSKPLIQVKNHNGSTNLNTGTNQKMQFNLRPLPTRREGKHLDD